jgi:KUP system potassium uptake protein
MLAAARGLSPELDFEPDDASYFLSRINIQRGPDRSMMRWRKRLFVGLAHNAANPAAYFCLPVDRTVVMASHVEL